MILLFLFIKVYLVGTPPSIKFSGPPLTSPVLVIKITHFKENKKYYNITNPN